MRNLLICLSLVFTSSLDTVGSTGCTSSACVFSNAYLRFGTGSQTSVNDWGLFVQPWYYSQIANAWYKLTYSSYPLDTAIGFGTGSSQWSGATVVDVYSLASTYSTTDYSGFIVDSSDSVKTVGHGVIVANRSFTLSGNPIILQNSFSLGANDSFVKIVTTVMNRGDLDIQNVIIWTGTRDDFVGTTDVNTKTRGNLNTGSFVAVTANDQSSRAIMITNPTEGVLFYSETPGVMTAYALCCSFSNVYNTNPLSLPPMTVTPTDGSYAAVLPLGTIRAGGSGSITWYYAAGAINSLSAVAQSVAAAQVIDSGAVLNSPTTTSSLSISSIGSFTMASSSTGSFITSPSSTESLSMSTSSTGLLTMSTSSTGLLSISTNSTGSLTASTSSTGSLTASTSSTGSSSVTQSTTRSLSASPSISMSPRESYSVSYSTSMSPRVSSSTTSLSTISPSSRVSFSSSTSNTQTSSMTSTATSTTSMSSTNTATVPVKVLNIYGPNITESIIITNQIIDLTNNALLYVIGIVPVASILLCGCCVGLMGLCYIYKRKEETTKVTKITEDVKIRVPVETSYNKMMTNVS